MKKRLIKTIFILTLVFAVTACSNGNGNNNGIGDVITPPEHGDAEIRAFHVYSELMQMLSLEDVDFGAFDADFDINMHMNMFGEDANFNSNGNIRTIVENEHMQVAMIVTTYITDLGEHELEPVTVELYMRTYSGGIADFHMAMGGEDLSTTFPTEMLEDMADAVISDAMNIPRFDINAVWEASIQEASGNTSVAMIVTSDEITNFMLEAMQMDSQLAMWEQWGLDVDMNFGEFLMTITVDENNIPLFMTMEMGMSVHFDEQVTAGFDSHETVVNAVITYTFNGFGDDVRIMM